VATQTSHTASTILGPIHLPIVSNDHLIDVITNKKHFSNLCLKTTDEVKTLWNHNEQTGQANL
jgi:hypothetical protein